MKMMNHVFYIFFLLSSVIVAANDSTNLVKYTPDFNFVDGIFLDFDQVKKNTPVDKARILTTLDYNDNDFFNKITSESIFSFHNNVGEKFDIPVKTIWGYADNGVLYKKVNQNFYRVTIVGAICHFVAYVTSYSYNSRPYYNSYDYYNYGYSPAYKNENTDLKQYIIDFKTGKTLEYNTKNLEVLLMQDPELYDEYISLRKKKKNQLKFTYIRKFNERNPIYFPLNTIF